MRHGLAGSSSALLAMIALWALDLLVRSHKIHRCEGDFWVQSARKRLLVARTSELSERLPWSLIVSMMIDLHRTSQR